MKISCCNKHSWHFGKNQRFPHRYFVSLYSKNVKSFDTRAEALLFIITASKYTSRVIVLMFNGLSLNAVFWKEYQDLIKEYQQVNNDSLIIWDIEKL